MIDKVINFLNTYAPDRARLISDSRQIKPGDIFFAYPGLYHDGRDYIDAAIAAGAAAIILEPGINAIFHVPCFTVRNLKEHCGEIASGYYGHPSRNLLNIGITGTNGKTSCSQWIAQALQHLNKSCAVIGTLGVGFPEKLEPIGNTTPDALLLHAYLANVVQQGAQAQAMEVSSIGLDQGRVAGIRFNIAVFTNLTHDHLDYHGTMSAYAEAKSLLFSLSGLRHAVINLDDDFGIQLLERLATRKNFRIIGYTLKQEIAECFKDACSTILQATNIIFKNGKTHATVLNMHLPAQHVDIAFPTLGNYNVANMLAVLGTLLAAEIDWVDATDVLTKLKSVPGRMEPIGGKNKPLVVIDYAHTPDALEKCLLALRQVANSQEGKLYCLFGCGGNRDTTKRPKMGAIAEQYADKVWLTNDNPRHENSQKIVGSIVSGMKTTPTIELNRELAIKQLIASATQNDVVLIAGKGHESYQEIAGERLPFSDVAIASLALKNWENL